ncbi:doublecortin domain-containing protein 2-like [Synchiropus picturatus]
MSSDKPNFLSQPVVKSVFMFRNGDPYYEARRIVINQRRVCTFETLLRDVTGGIQAPFGAVRNIYTPTGGHRVECLEALRSGERYVAAGRERFKKMDYLQIGSRKKRMMQTPPMQAKPLPHNRIMVSARFLKPIKEPCPIFVVANGDLLTPAMRLLIHQRMLGQFERILEMITEKMGLRVLGGVRSLYTYEGHQVSDGNQLESGQLYVAVGRERFKKLPYSDLLFTKPRGTRRVNGIKTSSLPPIYRFTRQNGNSKSTVRSGHSGEEELKVCPPSHSSKEHLSSIVREISQARLLSLRRKRSGPSMSLGVPANDDPPLKVEEEKTQEKSSQEDEKPASDGDPSEEEEEEATAENTPGGDTSEGRKESETHNETEEAAKEEEEQLNNEKEEEEAAVLEEKEEVKEDVKEEVSYEGKEDDGTRESSELEKDDQDKSAAQEKQALDGESGAKGNDVDTGEEERGNQPEKTLSANEDGDSRIQEEGEAPEERPERGEVSREEGEAQERGRKEE